MLVTYIRVDSLESNMIPISHAWRVEFFKLIVRTNYNEEAELDFKIDNSKHIVDVVVKFPAYTQNIRLFSALGSLHLPLRFQHLRKVVSAPSANYYPGHERAVNNTLTRTNKTPPSTTET